MRTRNHARASAWLMACLTLVGCDILDVENPNNLVEESIENEAAAAAVVNGSLSLVSEAISSIWQPYMLVSDEMYWIGSRDAWLELDQGFISNESNEFTDGAFPDLAQARWMADRAVEILEGHVADNPTTALKKNRARAYLYAGMAYMIIGEVQQDFAFSDKTEPAPPVGPGNMKSVLDQAIQKLDAAVAGAREVGDADLELKALAIRARAKFSRALWDKIKPTPKTGDPLINAAGAVADAEAVLDKVGETTDWKYNLTFSGSTVTNTLASWVNSRKENQFDLSLVNVNASKAISSVALKDPIDNIADPVITAALQQFKGGAITATGDSWPPLTIASARMMHLIIAEAALAGNQTGEFREHINLIRDMDGLTPFTGQISNLDMLKHSRRVNTFIMGLRLHDMYRFGIRDPKWQPQSDAIAAPGTLLPITIIEIRANCHLTSTC